MLVNSHNFDCLILWRHCSHKCDCLRIRRFCVRGCTFMDKNETHWFGSFFCFCSSCWRSWPRRCRCHPACWSPFSKWAPPSAASSARPCTSGSPTASASAPSSRPSSPVGPSFLFFLPFSILCGSFFFGPAHGGRSTRQTSGCYCVWWKPHLVF